MLENNYFTLIFLPSIKTLQFYLLPAGAILGMGLGILLGNAKFAQKWPWSIFWLMVVLDMLILKLVYFFLGDIWTRISFSFLMGYFAFSLKLLR